MSDIFVSSFPWSEILLIGKDSKRTRLKLHERGIMVIDCETEEMVMLHNDTVLRISKDGLVMESVNKCDSET